MAPVGTPGVLQADGPLGWEEHRFGLGPNAVERLRNSSVWVIGGGTGFGRAVAIGCALLGASVVVSSRRCAMLDDTVRQGEALGVEPGVIRPVCVDVTSEAEIATAWQDARAAFEARRARRGQDPAASPIALIYCSALGQLPFGLTPLADMPQVDYQRMMATNVTGAWLATRTMLNGIPPTAPARAVFLSSGAGWAGTPSVGAYNISKAALNSLGMSLAQEYSLARPDADIQINVLNPGEARTEMNQGTDVSAFTVVGMTALLISQPKGGPNGHFFHRDGQHLSFGFSFPFEVELRRD